MSKFNQQCFSQVRLVAAHKEWQKAQEQAVQVEVDRALTTAREAWVTKYQAEVEDHVKSEVENARDEMNARNEMNARDEMNARQFKKRRRRLGGSLRAREDNSKKS